MLAMSELSEVDQEAPSIASTARKPATVSNLRARPSGGRGKQVRTSPAIEFSARLLTLAVFAACGLMWLRAAIAIGSTFSWGMFAGMAALAVICVLRLLASLLNE
jgi:hypothetical protein